MPVESYFSRIMMKVHNLIDLTIDYFHNRKLLNKNKNKNKEKLYLKDHQKIIQENNNKLIKQNAENERKFLAKDLGLSSRASWKEIVTANDNKINNNKKLFLL